jgi:hypothetical protein
VTQVYSKSLENKDLSRNNEFKIADSEKLLVMKLIFKIWNFAKNV